MANNQLEETKPGNSSSPSMNQFDFLSIIHDKFGQIDQNDNKTLSVKEISDFEKNASSSTSKAAAEFVLNNFGNVLLLADNDRDTTIAKMKPYLNGVICNSDCGKPISEYAWHLGDDKSHYNRYSEITKKDLRVAQVVRSQDSIGTIVANVRKEETKEAALDAVIGVIAGVTAAACFAPPVIPFMPVGGVVLGAIAVSSLSASLTNFKHTGSNILNDEFQKRREMILGMKLDRLAP